MSWMEGVGPVKSVRKLGIKKGLHDEWYGNKKPRYERERKEIKKGNFWDIIDNPLYQVAAEAKGYNWDDWVKDAKGKVGTGPNDGTTRVRATVRAGRAASTQYNVGPNSANITTPAVPAEYEWMTIDEAKERGLEYEAAKTSRWRNKKTGEIADAPVNPYANQQVGGNATGLGTIMGRNKNWEDDWEELRDWGVHDQGVAEDLDEINGWLLDIVNVNKDIPKIIREGPKGKHYGIDGDIWEHYGLDEEPEPPKKLDWDSAEKNMQLATAVPSLEGYSTPKGITPVDLHGD